MRLLGPDVSVPNSLEAIYDLVMAEKWGDGLPVIPPTEERVREALRHTDRDPAEVLGIVPPGWGEATVLKVAVNAVMAGCRPEYLPVVLTAVQAVCQPRFNLNGIQATTNPVAVAGFVNGPVIGQLGFNAGYNCLGPGNRANATVGRALRLVLWNIGGGRPGELDWACHGHPGKYSFFFAENEALNPWEPVHVEQGFARDVSTVTVMGVTGIHNFLETTEDAYEMLRAFAAGMAFPTSNDYIFNGAPWLILCPEHAETLHQGGYSKAAVRQVLWENTRLPFRAFSRKNGDYLVRASWEPILGELTEDTLIPVADDPGRIGIVVAGQTGGLHALYLPTFGDTRPVTLPIADRSGRPIAAFGKPRQ